MALSSGDQLGHYKIQSILGSWPHNSLCKTGGNHQHKYRLFNELPMLSPGLTGAEQESEQEGSKKGASSRNSLGGLTLI